MTTVTSTPARPDPAETSHDLHLVSVLESGLPPELGTPNQPATYTVPLVFSRQVSPDERARIEAPAALRHLTAQTAAVRPGSDLRLVVSDRRLLVEGTTLEELRDGLAGALTSMLHEIGQELRSATADREAAVEQLAAQEARRAAGVHAQVASIRFE
jgi:hypothetical protein